MEDNQIIRLYFARSEEAIRQTAAKYGNYCHTIAYHILHNLEDSEECVNDTYWKAWGIIPPRRPKRLAAFLGKITRNLSLDRYRRYTAEKRGSGEMAVALEELGECVSSMENLDAHADEMVLTEILNRFLESLSAEQRRIFMRRYWYVSSVKEIAEDYGITESKVKMSLLRSRNQLKAALEKEGITL
jgi:RNA polymerase sigma-70 factor (ECF subfamily)